MFIWFVWGGGGLVTMPVSFLITPLNHMTMFHTLSISLSLSASVSPCDVIVAMLVRARTQYTHSDPRVPRTYTVHTQ